MAANRVFGCAWRLSRAHNDSGGTRRCDDGVVNPAARDDIAGSPVVVRARINNCSTRMTSLRMPTTRRGATPVPRMAGKGDEQRRRASCTMSCTA